MAHPKPWMASLFAIGLRASPELHKEHPETFTGTIEVIGRVERGQDRICDDAIVETIDKTVEELGVDPIEQRLFEWDLTAFVVATGISGICVGHDASSAARTSAMKAPAPAGPSPATTRRMSAEPITQPSAT